MSIDALYPSGHHILLEPLAFAFQVCERCVHARQVVGTIGQRLYEVSNPTPRDGEARLEQMAGTALGFPLSRGWGFKVAA